MTTKKTTTELRRCKGSARFGIEPHEAPISEIPKQPSRKDGLGVMCTEHWRAYVKESARGAEGGQAVRRGRDPCRGGGGRRRVGRPRFDRAPGVRPGPASWSYR
jgi:hypothetical protein